MKKLVGFLALAASSLWAQTAETIPFRAVMLPSNEVPAININASAERLRSGSMSFATLRGASLSASTDFNVTYQFPAEVRFTGLHIHKGRREKTAR